MKEKAKVISKRVKKGWFSTDYMLGLSFYDIVSNKSNTNTKEMKVSYMAYENVNVGDDVLCPMKLETEGLVFDFSQPLEKF